MPEITPSLKTFLKTLNFDSEKTIITVTYKDKQHVNIIIKGVLNE